MLNYLFGSSKNFPFNQALAYFRKVSSYEKGSSELANALFEIIRLCQIAIDESNKRDGDAHVLLANAYALAATGFSESYSYFLPRALATIQATRAGSMYIKNRETADKVYTDIVKLITEVGGIPPMTKDMLQGCYELAINQFIGNQLEIKNKLTSTPTENNKNTVDESDLEIIWDKWTRLVIPSKIEQTYLKAMAPIQETVFKLAEISIESGIINQTEAAGLGKITATAMVRLVRGSFIVGLEYGSREKTLDNEEIAILTKKALPLLDVVRTPTDTVIADLFALLVSKKLLSDKKAKNIAGQTGSQIADALLQCFLLGVEFSHAKSVVAFLKK